MAEDGRRVAGPHPSESPKERIDRELGELIDEIRVLLPGVEILFGFLITLPFSEGFRGITGFQRSLYLASLLCVSTGLALCIAPTTYHRLRFREGDKERLLFLANRLVIGAAALVACGMALSVYLVVQTMFGGTVAAVIAALNAVWLAWFWFGLPLVRRAADAT